MTLSHIILILCQPVFALTTFCCVLSGETTNTNFKVFFFTQSGLNAMIFQTQGKYANNYIADIWSSRFVILSVSTSVDIK